MKDVNTRFNSYELKMSWHTGWETSGLCNQI